MLVSDKLLLLFYRFVCNPNEIVIFDYHGRIKRLHWADSYSLNNFLPLVFRPNQYLCIKYSSQDDVTITLATEQQQQYKLKAFKKSTTDLKVLIHKFLLIIS